MQIIVTRAILFLIALAFFYGAKRIDGMLKKLPQGTVIGPDVGLGWLLSGLLGVCFMAWAFGPVSWLR